MWTVDTVIFDFDGVLVDTGEDIAGAANYVLRRFNLEELPVATIVSFIGGGVEPLIRKCLGDNADDLFPEALPLFKQRYLEYPCEKTVLYPGVPQVLAHYHSAGKKMAIATNKAESITQRIVDCLKLTPYFQIIAGPDSVAHRKPDPEIINLITTELNVSPAKTVMVGDSKSDILAGKAAGTITCGVTYGFGNSADIRSASPDLVVDRVETLIDYID